MISASPSSTCRKGWEETGDFGSQVASAVWGRSHCTVGSVSPRKHCIVLPRFRMGLEEIHSAPDRIPTLSPCHVEEGLSLKQWKVLLTPGKREKWKNSFFQSPIKTETM